MPAKSRITAKVSELYNTYPFPDPRSFRFCRQLGINGTDRVNFLLSRRRGRLIPKNADIWVAGCGTVQAAKVALSFPDASILATDISETSLELSSSLAKSLGLHNIEFMLDSISDSSVERKFDLIYCTGVLHHLSDPKRGAQVLAKALSKNGAIALFLYNENHRPTYKLQQVFRILSPDSLDIHLARDLVQEVLDSPSDSELKRVLAENSSITRNEAVFADTLMHPCERSYDIYGLAELMEHAGLRISAWHYPELWNGDLYIKNTRILRALKTLSEIDRLQVVHILAGQLSPYFFFYAERKGDPKTIAYSDAELSEFPFSTSSKLETFAWSGSAMSRTTRKAWRTRGDKLLQPTQPPWIVDPLGLRAWQCPTKLFDAFTSSSSGKPISQIRARVPRETRKFLRELISNGLLTPLYEA